MDSSLEQQREDPCFPMGSATMPPPSTTLPAQSRFTAGTSHDFDASLHALDYTTGSIAPSSLSLSHKIHDDTCVETCTVWNPQGLPRPPYPSALSSRSRMSISNLPLGYPVQDLSFYSPQAQSFNQFYPLYPPDDFKLPLNHFSGHEPVEHAPQMTCGFDDADVCTLPQCTVHDECDSVACSGFTCSSQCCSTQVCQDESCPGGTPCDDMHCMDGSEAQNLGWSVPTDWEGLVPPELDPVGHDQECNHTNAEHDVAKTLRDLRAPADPHQAQQQFNFPQLCGSIFPNMDQGLGNDHEFQAILENSHPGLTYESPLETTPIEAKTPLKIATEATEHVCMWAPDSHDAVCGKVFGNALDLNHHLCKDHIALMSSKTKYLCLWKGCPRRHDQVFASRNKLRRHIFTHSSYKPFPCPQCGESFSAQQALDQHIRTHTGEKPFQCPVDGCGKSFKQKSALTMHVRTHTGEKPLKCEICGKSFCESSNLSKHRKTHNPEYKFKCEEPGCDSQFIRVDQLRRHQAKHVRQKKKTKARSSQNNLPATSGVESASSRLSIDLDSESLYEG